MPKIRVERVPVQAYSLGLLGFDHLQLVYQQDEGGSGEGQDFWFVIEGLREPGADGVRLAVEGANGGTMLLEANGGAFGADLIAKIGTPQQRGSQQIAAANPPAAWAVIAASAADIDAQAFPYFSFSFAGSPTPTLNSSSLIATLLLHIGVDISTSMPFGTRLSPGTQTLLGSSLDDTMAISGSFTTLVSGAGNDTLHGGASDGQIDKLYGGSGNDVIMWSAGFNILHGGLTDLDYASDGSDTVNYTGVGIVEIKLNPYAVPHYQPTYIATSATATDHLYSIEEIEWDQATDIVVLGEGVGLIERPIRLSLGGEDSAGGDRVDMSSADLGLLVTAGEDSLTFVQAGGRSETEAGLWADGAEWIVGSPHDDRIYAGAGIRVVEGEAGNDLIDARAAAPFSGESPHGFDIEIDGGAGADTIVSGLGRTLARGGEGPDRFVLSAMTFGVETVELVIEDASAEDRVLVPYDVFNTTCGDAEGSALFPLLGAFSQQPGRSSFADLPENLGPWTSGPSSREDFFRFEWLLQDQHLFGSDETQGDITFAGAILYNREGGDLLIHVFLGYPLEVTTPGSNEVPWAHTVNIAIPPSETIIRIKDFEDGDLGIVFHDIGKPTPTDIETDHGSYGASFYSGWDDAVRAMTGDGALAPALAPRVQAPVHDPDDTDPGDEHNIVLGTDNDDAITREDARDATIRAGAGNDRVAAGDGDDVIDGGAGADAMGGGRGDDIYDVGEAGDQVMEDQGHGIDTVRAAVDYVLPDFVENLTLLPGAASSSPSLALLAADTAARTGTGNAERNRILGNDADNILSGLDGADTLFGGLGNDVLDGGQGSDGFVYGHGHGDDVIIDAGDAGDRDALVLAGIEPGSVSFHRLAASPDDLVLTVREGGRILLRDFWAAPGRSIDDIRFDDGTVWTRDHIEARGRAAPLLDGDPPPAQDDGGVALGPGDDRLVSSAAADVIKGGAGRDVFVFRDTFGRDVIVDFHRGTADAPQADVITLKNQGIQSMGALREHAVQAGADTIITLDGGTITLVEGALARLHADDFHFA